MQKQSASGLALILGAVGGIATMAFHPSSSDIFRAGAGTDGDAIALRNIAVHTLGIASAWAVLFGTLGVRERLSGARDLANAGLVAYLLAVVAVTIAAAASGFIGTDVAFRVLRADEATRPAFEALFSYTGIINQAFAKINVVASSAALAFWSVAILRLNTLPRGAGVTGLIVGAVSVIAVLAGMPLDIHGFGAIVLGQTVWLVWVGTALRRGD